ncbi:MAG: glycerol-3-phosphate 1-O-acyltransferase PlsY [Firmicutes bacterium]|nr:glycerol-3-phosphate 1-O-acyltransferase PlsY [Bacillota bacterium]
MTYLLVFLFAYLLGSIPCGYLVGRWFKGLDIRKHGSGNIGTTNAFRILGPGPGALVLLGDVLKGLIAVLVAEYFTSETVALFAGLVAIAGHSWPIYLGFKGGRGVATGAGVILALSPLGVLLLLLIWVLTILITRYVSVGSILAAAAAPFVLGFVEQSWLLAFFGLLAGAGVIYRHKANIERLKRGTEPKVGGGYSTRW